jgi:outer membrane protein
VRRFLLAFKIKIVMIKNCIAILLILLQTLPLSAADPSALWSHFMRPYEAHPFPAVDLSNSPRIRQLLRAGNIYLSLSDAVALAIENNLDIALQRYDEQIADYDLLRTKGGGLPRGLDYTLAEVPVGVGGPASPLVTAAANLSVPGTSVPTNPSELGALVEPQDNYLMEDPTSLSAGSPIPLFDPALAYQLNWSHQTSPELNPNFAGTNALVTNTTLANGSYVQGFGPGTQLSVGFNNLRETLNSPNSSLYSPFTSSNFGFTVTQPLLRGFGLAVNRRYIRIAKVEKQIGDLLLQQQLIATVFGVVRLYTDLVALYDYVKVEQETLASADQLYADTKARVEEGTQAPVELTRANAQVFSIRQDLINANGLLEEQEAIVKNVITRRTADDEEVLTARIIPTDNIDVPEKDEIRPIQDLLAEAFATRPDLKQAGLQVDISQISLEGSRNNLLPEIDLVGVAQNSSLVGETNPLAATTNPTFIGGYGSALEQLVTRKYPTYGIGLNFNLPLRNRIAQADFARDEIQLRRTQIRVEQLRKQAQLEVEDALVAMRRARGSYEAALQSQALQQESLEAEQAKFDVGASTAFFIVQYQSYLAQARSTVVVAKSAYLKARAALERAVGSILDDNHVILPEAMRGRH